MNTGLKPYEWPYSDAQFLEKIIQRKGEGNNRNRYSDNNYGISISSPSSTTLNYNKIFTLRLVFKELHLHKKGKFY